MNELLNDEQLTTADLVNPPRTTTTSTGLPGPDGYEDGGDFSADRISSNRIPLERVPADSLLDERNPQPFAVTHQAVAAPNQSAAVMNQEGQPNQLFPQDELQSFRSHWDKVQTSFVDEPRVAVEQADSLVANVVKRIAEQFASEREQLEKQWDRGEDVNTEDLRQAIKRYRAFFDRLLAL
jgi:hypothetical protein